MRTWYRVALILFVLGAFVPLALAGTSLVGQAIYADRGTARSCDAAPLDPFTFTAGPLDGQVVLHLTNEGSAASIARVCLFQGETKRLDTRVQLGPGERTEVVVVAPPGVYTYQMEASHRDDGGRSFSTAGSGTFSTMWCLSHSGDTYQSYHVGPDGSGGSAFGGGCLPAPLLVGLVGLVASGGSFALGKFPGIGALLLYSRLARPRVLEQAVRAQVLDLVGREPGIHSREIVRGLDAAEGQIAYHLGVLAREKHLVSIGTPGFRRWFVTGRYSPDQMRAIATLRDPTRGRVYDAVVAKPGASLSEVADAIGVSLPQTSRAVSALVRGGLVERQANGRSLALRPARAPVDVFGAASA